VAAPLRSHAEPRGLKGERRHLTVLFCDLVNSTAISAQLDPDEWREIVAEYHRAVAEAIERYGGHVAQYQGDGVMAYFGYPEAHGNDAERAARAGLAIVDALSKLDQQPTRPELLARIGMDSGAVVVGASAGLRAWANPMELYRVLRPTRARGRLDAAHGLTPLVGREEELRLLLSRWERTREGEGSDSGTSSSSNPTPCPR
jgi:Adenylate and Guanylate cyclase catalytic domain